MKQIYILLISGMFTLTACEFNVEELNEPLPEDNDIEALEIPNGFDFSTSQEIDLEVAVENLGSTIVFDVYDQEDNLLLRASTDKENGFTTTLNLPSHHDSIWVKPQQLGVISAIGIEIINGRANCLIAPNEITVKNQIIQNNNRRTTSTFYQTIGNWDSQGRPTYLESQKDVIPQQLLDDINASLPETRPVPIFNPDYLIDQNMNTELQAEADIWITFVHEGAGWKNTLGYYTYDINNPPTSVDEIDNHYIIFPNVSYSGSGGNLSSGDKVYLGRFPSNVGIGWFLIPNAWDAGSASVLDRSQVKYSVKQFNTFTDTEYAQHVILLKDNTRELLLLGIEDTSRPAGDNDFNDAVFYVSANPYSAIITSNFQEITESKDTDNDGILDHLDEYPEDTEKAFNSFIPAKNVTGSLAFEDLWPAKGDYDFNDLVMDYQYKKVLSANMRVQEIEASFTIKAIGGYYHNGFGIELPFANSIVQSVAGNVLNNKYVTSNGNGTESGQEKAVIIAFEDAYEVMPVPQNALLVNARKQDPYVNPVSLTIAIDLIDDQYLDAQLGASTINPFLIVNGTRGHEIHLPGKSPTDLMDYSLFGTEADNSLPNNERFYITDRELPWAINLSRTFDYPIENTSINKAHSYFNTWAESSGSLNSDWYYNKAGHRNTRFIY
ncbi:MAG: LruC domain-containing protein [Bacteroidota bacterium]